MRCDDSPTGLLLRCLLSLVAPAQLVERFVDRCAGELGPAAAVSSPGGDSRAHAASRRPCRAVAGGQPCGLAVVLGRKRLASSAVGVSGSIRTSVFGKSRYAKRGALLPALSGA